jgi:putative ABC transport system permease protein
MIKSYLLIAFRNIIRHKVFSLIVILSLTIGIAIFGLIFLYVNHELSYDRFNKHYESTYRLEFPDWALTGTAYGPEIAQQFPEIQSFTRISIMEGSSVTLKIGDKLMKLDHMIYADSGFFDVFSFRFVKGNPHYVINVPNYIVLTESTARKIFGDEDPMNKSIMVNNKVTYTVMGIIEDVTRFHLKINAVASFVSLREFYNNPDFLNQYQSWNYYTYFNLEGKSNAANLADKINDYYTNKAEWPDSRPVFTLRPLKDIYFSQIKYDFPNTRANRSMLRFYMLIAIFILAIACINFINLTMARATTRSREIGMRKVMGANRHSLVNQYLGESIIYALIATEFSLVLMELLRPLFNNLVQRHLYLFSLQWGQIVFIILLLPVLIGILAGIYPALYLTRFKPVITLKNEKTRGRGSLFFRRLLIVGQFTISIVLIIATLTVYKQFNYLRKADLGFSKNNVINLELNSSLQKHHATFREMLLSESQIKGVSFTTQSMENVTWQESIEIGTESKQYTYLGIDTEFIPLMGMKIIEGRNFQRNTPSDSGKIIINEEAIPYFNVKEPVVGQVIGTGWRRYEILGVVKNFHFNSLRSPIGPLVMMLQDQYISTVNIKVTNECMAETINHLKSTWATLCPDFLFEFRFLDKSYEQLYYDEMRLSKLFLYLALLSIFIASIGLMGLSSLLTEQRIKEIGIRKVMGDTTTGIMRLISKEFGKWVIVSGIIAIPVAYYIMNKWLDGFAYQVSVDVYILVGSCLIALTVALITVIGQTYGIATRNPVKSLRYE